MKITIKATNIRLTESIKSYIERKLDSTQRVLKNLYTSQTDENNPIEKRKGRIGIYVNVGRESAGTKKGMFFSKAQIDFPGKDLLMAQASAGKLLEAIDEMKDELHRLIVDKKEKPLARRNRNVKKAKKDLNLSEGARMYRKGRIRDEGL